MTLIAVWLMTTIPVTVYTLQIYGHTRFNPCLICVHPWLKPLRKYFQTHNLGIIPSNKLRSHHPRGVDISVSQERGGLFGQDRVDVEAAAPFESGDARQTRHDLHVPVIML